MKYLRDHIEHAITDRHVRSNKSWERRTTRPMLHPSAIAGCPRAAILGAVQGFKDHALHQAVTNPFDTYTQTVMMSGNVWEAELGKMLKWYIPDLDLSYHDTHGLWSWELDGFLEEDDANLPYPGGLIVELKDTAEYNFRIKDRLPYRHHLIQVAAYQVLMNKKYQVWYPATIYYNGRGPWAEFQVHAQADELLGENPEVINYKGLCNDHSREGQIEFELRGTMNRLEGWWRMQELPPKYEDPFEHHFTCCKGSDKKGFRPACKWFGQCWQGQLPVEGPFDRSAFSGHSN